MDFQAVARQSRVKAPGQENENSSPLVWYPGSYKGVSPQDPRMLQTDLTSLELSYRENVDRTDV